MGAGEWGGDWGTGIVRKGEERYWEPLGQLKDSRYRLDWHIGRPICFVVLTSVRPITLNIVISTSPSVG